MDAQCFVCFERGGLVRPCYNEKCSARIHESCLEKYYLNNKKCYCGSNIVVVTEFDFGDCITVYLARIYLIFLLLFSHPLMLFLIMGNSLFDETIDPSSNNKLIDKLCGSTIIFLFFSWLFSFILYIPDGSTVFQRCSFITKLYSLAYSVILVSHVAGYFVTGKEFFNLLSFYQGLFALILGGILSLFAIGVYQTFQSTLKEFYKIRRFGVKI